MKVDDDEMQAEYDFSKGVRNPYFERIRNGTNLVLIEPDLFRLFPDTEAVNDALRELLQARHDLARLGQAKAS